MTRLTELVARGAHRDRHPGVAGRRRRARRRAWPHWPTRPDGWRYPTSPACCRRPGRPACRSCTAWCNAAPTGWAPTTTRNCSRSAAAAWPSNRAVQARRCCPNSVPSQRDLVLHRWHGLGPMGGTDLDAILRNLGVTTIVAVGVSLNVAIPNLVMDAVNAGLPGGATPGCCRGHSRRVRRRRHRQHAGAAGHRHHHRRPDRGLAVGRLPNAAPAPAHCSSPRRSACSPACNRSSPLRSGA